MEYLLLLVTFVVILAGALTFTNAVEWLGHRLSLGQGAVGSLLAAVGTAMPETLIPVVAIIGGQEGSEDVAIGAIVGAPFLLATLAMLLIGVASHSFHEHREQGKELELHQETVRRDLRIFIAFFALALIVGIGVPDPIRWASLPVMLIAYGLYVRKTLKGGGQVQEEDSLDPLFFDRSNPSEPRGWLIGIQFAVSLAAIFAGAHFFVEELIKVAETLGIAVIVLSLVLAPLATELPEKANSVIWVRQGKDSLALGNVTGAMVFQSMIPVAFGIAFTEWDLDRYAILSMCLGLAGGAVAYFALLKRGRFPLWSMLCWGALYGTFVLYVIFS